ncbi:hypothetical protein [Deefgea salmonis]|uniref:Uncharacterized protein n=1 Tax=Deefgea salmonis TaxID=2875502 RepID=A0ABS8BMT5_9NEIS|nr:hypothetical protein [Deefgea salmonis]MCB5196861.1 hypothetical protein [Deefgea salmonis]
MIKSFLRFSLDVLGVADYIGRTEFNSLARIGVRIVQAAAPSWGIFFAVITIGASSMGGRSLVGIFGCERFLNTLTPTTLLRLPTSIGVERQINLICSGAFTMPKHARTFFTYSLVAITTLAIERNTPIAVVALSLAALVLVHVIGSVNRVK